MQQARALIIGGSLLVIVVGIRCEGLRQLEWRNFKNGVDKMAASVGRRWITASVGPHKTAARKLLRSLLISVGLGLSDARSYRASIFKKARLPAGFLFLAHRISLHQR